MSPQVIIVRARLPRMLGIHNTNPNRRSKWCCPAIGRFLDLTACTKPGIDKCVPITGILDHSLPLLFVIICYRAIAQKQVKSIESAIPAVKYIATTGAYNVVFERTTGSHDDPFEVSLAMEITRIRRRRTNFGIIQATIVGTAQYPSIPIGMTSVENKVRCIDPVIVVTMPV